MKGPCTHAQQTQYEGGCQTSYQEKNGAKKWKALNLLRDGLACLFNLAVTLSTRFHGEYFGKILHVILLDALIISMRSLILTVICRPQIVTNEVNDDEPSAINEIRIHKKSVQAIPRAQHVNRCLVRAGGISYQNPHLLLLLGVSAILHKLKTQSENSAW